VSARIDHCMMVPLTVRSGVFYVPRGAMARAYFSRVHGMCMTVSLHDYSRNRTPTPPLSR
jgi:hypothetical protein